MPHEEIVGVVPTDKNRRKIDEFNLSGFRTQWLSVSQTSSVIWCVPSDRQVVGPEFASKTDPFPLIGPQALDRSPSILLVQE